MPEHRKFASGMETAMMDRTGKFECTMPFHTLRVDLWEGSVKRMLRGETFVTMRQLRYSFKYYKNFEKHIPFKSLEEPDGSPDTTPTLRLITNPFFKHDDK